MIGIQAHLREGLSPQEYEARMKLLNIFDQALKTQDMPSLVKLLQDNNIRSQMKGIFKEILSKAVAYDNLDAFKLLLDVCDNVEAKAVALAVAARHNRIDFVQHLLQMDDVKQFAVPRYLGGDGALTNAIYNGRIDIAACLLKEKGARDALINQPEAILAWAMTNVLTWIDEQSSILVSGDTPRESVVNVIDMLVSIFRERELDLNSRLNDAQRAVLATFGPGRLSLRALAARKISSAGWNNVPSPVKEKSLIKEMLRHAKREREEDNTLAVESAKKQETVLHVGLSSSTTSSSSSSTASSSASSSSQNLLETDNLDNLMSETLLNQMRGLSVEELWKFILEQNLLSNPIYDNETWHQIAKLLNIKDEWHSELNDDQKLKVDSFFTMMEFVIESYPDTLIDALELSELVQMPVVNSELCKFMVEKNLLAEQAYSPQTWSRIAQLLNMKDDWNGELNDEQKQKLDDLCNKIDFIARNFPAPLIEALGLSEMMQMRRLDLGDNAGHTGYLDFITAEQMGDDNMAYGVDRANRPFLTVKYDIETRRNVPRHPESFTYAFHGQPGVSVDTLFQRYTDSSIAWVPGTRYGGGLIESAVRPYCSLHSGLLNFLNRLSHDKPVGIFDYDNDALAYVESDRVVAKLARRR